jgi:hypothetical protein
MNVLSDNSDIRYSVLYIPGISSSLRNKNSAGKFEDVAFNLPAPLSNLIPLLEKI